VVDRALGVTRHLGHPALLYPDQDAAPAVTPATHTPDHRTLRHLTPLKKLEAENTLPNYRSDRQCKATRPDMGSLSNANKCTDFNALL